MHVPLTEKPVQWYKTIPTISLKNHPPSLNNQMFYEFSLSESLHHPDGQASGENNIDCIIIARAALLRFYN